METGQKPDREVVDEWPRNTCMPKPFYRECPRCGAKIELWSDENRAECPQCGVTLYRNNEN